MATAIAVILVVTFTFALVEGQGRTIDCSQYEVDTPCPRSLIPMCGDDHVTYSNDCVFCQNQHQVARSGRTPPSFLHDGDCAEDSREFRALTSNPSLAPTQPPTQEAPRQSVLDVLWPWLRQQRATFYEGWSDSVPALVQTLLSDQPASPRPLPRLPECRGADGSCPYSTPVCSSTRQTFPSECHVCDVNRYRPWETITIVRDGPCQ